MDGVEDLDNDRLDIQMIEPEASKRRVLILPSMMMVESMEAVDMVGNATSMGIWISGGLRKRARDDPALRSERRERQWYREGEVTGDSSLDLNDEDARRREGGC